MTTITKERLLKIQHWRETYGAGSNVILPAEEAEELARIALASPDAETVRYLNKFSGTCVTLEQQPNAADDVAVYIPLYAAPPVPERERIRREHAEWSDKTFGDVGPVGPLKHLSKEALEAAAEPDDLSEWADMQFLLWDAQRRAGITDKQITLAMVDKLAVNKQREWPEPKDGEPRLHIKEQPAPVVPFYRDGIEAAASWVDKQRQAFDNEHGRYDSDTGAFEFGNDAQRDYSDTLAELADGIRGLHLNAGDNSPVTPDCWIPVSERMPGSQEWVIVFAKWANQQVLCWDDVQNRWTDFEDESYYADMFTHWMPLPAPPQH
ncbi:DUF550 domain-containing protein [Salmonella enterica]|nr:DUF550 domain-containing protein [Salmonella enterica]HAE9348273.1 DUF550 domain-containing protein [Salmonella enterica subsp. enterica serovar Panama]EIK1037082.1 DUF550 domain-containing protein [Salmonella enterica]EIR5468479.1 DUF550 domain-containing protein [Salmonella enterica]EJA0674752.1 DUF550 domain-containing protein [Salmonella enterica]